MNFPPQACYFYHGVWTPVSDAVMLSTLIALKKETMWAATEFPSWFWMTIGYELVQKLGVKVSEDEIGQRVEFLRTRYKLFKDIVCVFRVQWDQQNKVIVAGEDLWKHILKHHWLAEAYYSNDELDYTTLTCVFGMADVKMEKPIGMTSVKVEKPKEVIQISETVELVSTEELPFNDGGKLNEEINSPATFPQQCSPRALSC